MYNEVMEILFAEPDDHVIDRKSSISQHTDKLGVWKKGQFIPLSYDHLDYIDCDKVTSHKAVLSSGGDLGFNYPTGSCTVITDEYLLSDLKEEVVRELPEWYGTGFYEALVDKFTMTLSDDSSLGLRHRRELAVGLDYVKCKTVIPAVE